MSASKVEDDEQKQEAQTGVFNKSSARRGKRTAAQKLQEASGVGLKEIEYVKFAVLGGQSAGKSTFIKLITGVPTPAKLGTGTRVPIEIQGWKENAVYIRRKVNDYEDELIQKFPDNPNNAEIEFAIWRAQCYLLSPKKFSDQGLNWKPSWEIKDHEQKFGENCRVVVKTMTLPEGMTIVDMPGLIAKDEQTDNDIKIEKMNRAECTKKECVIVCCLPCQDILDMEKNRAYFIARKEDPTGERTIGILTKPDLIERGTEDKVKDIFKNRKDSKYHLKVGYYVFRGTTPSEVQKGKTASDDWFKSDPIGKQLTQIHRSRIGRDNITQTLDRLQEELAKKKLPDVVKIVRDRLRDANDDLREHGPPETAGAIIKAVTGDIENFVLNSNLSFEHVGVRHRAFKKKTVGERDAMISNIEKMLPAWIYKNSTVGLTNVGIYQPVEFGFVKEIVEWEDVSQEAPAEYKTVFGKWRIAPILTKENGCTGEGGVTIKLRTEENSANDEDTFKEYDEEEVMIWVNSKFVESELEEVKEMDVTGAKLSSMNVAQIVKLFKDQNHPLEDAEKRANTIFNGLRTMEEKFVKADLQAIGPEDVVHVLKGTLEEKEEEELLEELILKKKWDGLRFSRVSLSDLKNEMPDLSTKDRKKILSVFDKFKRTPQIWAESLVTEVKTDTGNCHQRKHPGFGKVIIDPQGVIICSETDTRGARSFKVKVTIIRDERYDPGDRETIDLEDTVKPNLEHVQADTKQNTFSNIYGNTLYVDYSEMFSLRYRKPMMDFAHACYYILKEKIKEVTMEIENERVASRMKEAMYEKIFLCHKSTREKLENVLAQVLHPWTCLRDTELRDEEYILVERFFTNWIAEKSRDDGEPWHEAATALVSEVTFYHYLIAPDMINQCVKTIWTHLYQPCMKYSPGSLELKRYLEREFGIAADEPADKDTIVEDFGNPEHNTKYKELKKIRDRLERADKILDA